MTLTYQIINTDITDEGLRVRVTYVFDFVRNGTPRQRTDTLWIALPRHTTLEQIHQSISNRLNSEVSRITAVLTAQEIQPTIPLNTPTNVVIV